MVARGGSNVVDICYLREGSLKIGKYIGNLLDTWARNYLEVSNKLDISQ